MAQTAMDYSDIFCQAVQNIVNGTVSNLNFDISRECTIIDIIDKAYGKYQVHDGSTAFEAIATEGSTYEEGDRVMVTIPQGDSNKQIIILSKIVDEWGTPAGFVRPLDTVASCTGNIAFDEHDEKALLANGKTSRVEILRLTNQKFFGFQKVGVAAKFKSLLDNLGIIKGDYGLIFTLVQNSKSEDVPKRVDQHIFSCSDMLGNPYAFNSYFEQEYAFNIDKDVKQINELIVEFYQNGQFIDGNDNVLDFSSFGKNYYNLFVKDLEIYLGYPQGKEISEIVEIFSDNLEYTGSGNETRDVYIQWIHKLDEYHFENITHQKYFNGENIYEIRWYQYTSGCPDSKTDEYGGKHWELLNKTKPENAWDNYPFTFTVNVRPTYTEEKIKAVCLVKTYPLINDPTYEQIVKFDSNTLTFENTKEGTGEDTPPDETLKKNLYLHFHDNSYGNYFLYDQNGILIDSATQGQSYPRQVEIFYDGEPLNKNQNWFNSIDAITWELPAPNENTSMIYYDKSQKGGFVEPNQDLLYNENDSTDWTKMYKTSDSNDFIFNNNVKFEEFEEKVIGVSVEGEKDYIITEISNAINGKFNLKTKASAVLNIKDTDGKDVDFSALNLSASIIMSIWVQEQPGTWTLVNNQYKTVNVQKECKLSEIEGLFAIAAKHDNVRIGFGLAAEQGSDFNKLLETHKDKNISWTLYISSENTSFTVQSEFYTNTTYPTKDNEGKTVLDTIFTYSILNSWSRDRNNNTIRCKIFIDDKEYLLQEDLRFGTKGSNGTSNTFILEMLDGKNALTTTTGSKPTGSDYYDTLRVEAILIKGNGKRYYFTSDQIKNEISWELINNDATTNINDEIVKYIKLDTANDNPDRAIKSLFLQVNEVPNNNYAILKASFKYEVDDDADDGTINPTLEAYLPIPIKHHTCLSISGPTEVLYDHQGRPRTGNNVYVAYTNDKEFYSGWSVTQPTKEVNGKIINSNPNPVDLVRNGDPNNGVALKTTPLYSKGKSDDSPIYDKACVYCEYEDENDSTIRLWSQPILIMQSNYDFAMLNEWDGSLTIDEENGIILATMLGAGRKNEQNQFSGVLLGDVKEGTDLDNAPELTGVYGFQNGIVTYALKENGTAFFGPYKKGRIEIDGEHGIIRSAGWKKDTSGNWILNPDSKQEEHDGNLPVMKTGTLIDLDDGQLQIIGKEDNYFKFNVGGNGKLEASLSGASIFLTDKTGNPSLSGYISATAQGLTSEFRRTAVYAITCTTESAEATKVLPLEDFSKAAFTNNDVGISGLTVENILQDGVTIAVTFVYAENVTVTQIPIVKTVEGEEIEVGKREKRTGRILNLALSKDDKLITDTIKSIYVNGKTTNAIPSFTTDKVKLTEDENSRINNNTNSNPYGWAAGSIIYFTYKNGHWEVSDSGSYSRITQTADMIKSEVSNISGTLGSSITQTANKIRMEVSKKANYNCTCSTADGTNPKDINGGPTNEIENGCTLSIKFINANTKTTSGLKFKINDIEYNVASSPKWEAGETLPFVYDGSQFIMTSISHSVITQTANAITSEVRRTAGYGCTAYCPTNDPKYYGGSYTMWKIDSIYGIGPGNNQTNLSGDDLLNAIKQSGITLAVTFNNSFENQENKESEKPEIWLELPGGDGSIKKYYQKVYLQGKATNADNKLIIKPYDTIYFSFMTDNTDYGGHWNVVDSGAYSKIIQTADTISSEISSIEENLSTRITQTNNEITAEVTRATGTEEELRGLITVQADLINAKVSSSGGANGFEWSLTDSGFILTSTIGNASTNVFVCNKDGLQINGNGTFTGTIYANAGEFAGSLTATATYFNSIVTNPIIINGSSRQSVFSNGHFELAIGTDSNADLTEYKYGGYLKIGAPEYYSYDDVTIWSENIHDKHGQTGRSGYGNLGVEQHPWDMLFLSSGSSKRELKQDILPYNIEQAYEELKVLPLYTYRYLRGNSSKTIFLGTMVDYMPIEFMRTTNQRDGTFFEPNNIIFWNIAASQVMQQKIEELTQRVNYLEEERKNYGIN